MRLSTIVNSSILCLAIVASCLTCYAETEPDFSACFNNDLSDLTTYESNTQYTLALLSIITRDNYNEAKKGFSANVLYEGLDFSGQYDQFDKSRSNYCSSKKLDIKYYQSLAFYQRTWPKESLSVISNCIDKVAESQLGMHVVKSSSGVSHGSFQLFWNPTNRDRLKIKKITIVNGAIENGEKPPTGGLFSKPLVVEARTPIFEIRRIKMDEDIVVTVTTEPDRYNTKITINAVNPQPVYETVKVNREQALETNEYGQNRWTSAGGNLIYHDTHLDGKFVSCELRSKVNDHFEVCPHPGACAEQTCQDLGQGKVRIWAWSDGTSARIADFILKYESKEVVCTANCPK